MTRLLTSDIEKIVERMALHEKELQVLTGNGMVTIAADAAGVSVRSLFPWMQGMRVGIVPVTTGLGIINGFSAAIEGILDFMGIDCFVTEQTDVAGMIEAVNNGAQQLFMADDVTCSLLDLKTSLSADNSICTGKGFAAALAMKSGSLKDKVVSVLGVGPVGCAAIEYFLSKGAKVAVYDKDADRLEALQGKDGVIICQSRHAALALGQHYFEATTASDTITLADMSADTFVAAPGMPLGITQEAFEQYQANIIHDTLEIGVASMVTCLMAEKAAFMQKHQQFAS